MADRAAPARSPAPVLTEAGVRAPPVVIADPLLADLLLRPGSFRWNRELSPGSIGVMVANLDDGDPELRAAAEASLAAAAAWTEVLERAGVGPVRLRLAAALSEHAAGSLGLALMDAPEDSVAALARYRAEFLAWHRFAGIRSTDVACAAAAAALAVDAALRPSGGPRAARMRAAAAAMLTAATAQALGGREHESPAAEPSALARRLRDSGPDDRADRAARALSEGAGRLSPSDWSSDIGREAAGVILDYWRAVTGPAALQALIAAGVPEEAAVAALEARALVGLGRGIWPARGRGSLDHTERARLDHRSLPAGRVAIAAPRGPGAPGPRPGH